MKTSRRKYTTMAALCAMAVVLTVLALVGCKHEPEEDTQKELQGKLQVEKDIKALAEKGAGTYKVTATGTVGNDDVHYIREALWSLPNGVLVDLDLSQVTGLTELKASSGTEHSNNFESCRSLSKITLPNTITGFLGGFEGCWNLTSIEIPEGVTGLSSAFGWCEKLTEITIPKNVEWIDNRSFHGCTSLYSVTFQETSNWYAVQDTEQLITVTNPEVNAQILKLGLDNYDTTTSSQWGPFNFIKRK